MGEFNLRRESIEMNLQFFALLLLLVLAVNGAPKPDPKAIPKAGPKPKPYSWAMSGMMKSQPMRMKSQPMTIVFPGGQIRGNGMVIDNYGNDYNGNSGFGNNGGFGGFQDLSGLLASAHDFGNNGGNQVSGNRMNYGRWHNHNRLGR